MTILFFFHLCTQFFQFVTEIIVSDSPTLLMTVTEAVLNFDRASTSWFANVEKVGV